jgi:hypothetical protein
MEKSPMKRFLILTLSLLIASAASFAGEKDEARAEGNRNAGDDAARKKEIINFSEEQIEQMRQIVEKGGSPEEMREKVQALLTDEQREKLNKAEGEKTTDDPQG